MCGIAGIFHSDPSNLVAPQVLRDMVRALDHRGPDDHGTFVDGAVGLCHTRLSVIDLSARGHQPMLSRDGRYALVYNGEVYNFRELRAELEAKGCEFSSSSDSEVVLQVLAQMGAAGVARLEGMFAFAFWDHEKGSLLLARDRLGIKPLFWMRGTEGIAFASEPKAFPRTWRPGRPDPARVAEYLVFRHVVGSESLQPEVQTLAPGHWMEIREGQSRIERYWRPTVSADGNPGDVERVIEAAVNRQLVSDVPVGIFLSGGVDSALVTAAATKSLGSVDSFTVGFSEAGWDESERAQVVAQHCGTRPHAVSIDPNAYVDGLVQAIWHLDSPLNHAHSPHLLELSRVARQSVTVALTGEGGDELFAGYPRYRLLLAARFLSAAPGPALRALARSFEAKRPRWARILDAAAGDSAHAIAINSAFLPLDHAAALAGLDHVEALLSPRLSVANQALSQGLDVVDALLSLERQTYLVSLLQRMDRLSMAVGLECRVPLLDERVVEHSLSLPSAAKLTLRDSKIPLRQAASRRFGHAYANAPKSGFGVPLDVWFRGEGRLARLLRFVLTGSETRNRNLFDAELATRFLAEHRDGVRDRTEALWGLLNLELWARIGLDGQSPRDVLGEI